nr:MAG: hypothetical protein DIU54_04670 [Acidobacteriota bacterium]
MVVRMKLPPGVCSMRFRPVGVRRAVTSVVPAATIRAAPRRRSSASTRNVRSSFPAATVGGSSHCPTAKIPKLQLQALTVPSGLAGVC